VSWTQHPSLGSPPRDPSKKWSCHGPSIHRWGHLLGTLRRNGRSHPRLHSQTHATACSTLTKLCFQPPNGIKWAHVLFPSFPLFPSSMVQDQESRSVPSHRGGNMPHSAGRVSSDRFPCMASLYVPLNEAFDAQPKSPCNHKLSKIAPGVNQQSKSRIHRPGAKKGG
jgi:hypothetical protein